MLLGEDIKEIVFKAVKELYNKKVSSDIEIPKNQDYGDYASNVSFSLAKELKKSPKDIANQIAEKLNSSNVKHKISFLAKAQGGFVNISLEKKCLNDLVLSFEDKEFVSEDYGKSNAGKGRKVLIEFVSANPTGPLHVGHGRWAAIGDSLNRILNFCGYKSDSEYYINDAGVQVQKLRESVAAAKNGQDIPEDGYQGKYIYDLAGADEDPVNLILKDQRETLKSFNVEFDNWFSEKKLHNKNEVDKALDILKKKKSIYEKEGAVWFRSTDFGDDKDRVLIKSDGQKTYFASDVAYHQDKIGRGYEWLINIWGTDHHGYVSRLRSAVSALCSKGDEHVQIDDDRFKVILGQLVTLYQKGQPLRMSKRTGEIITLKEVIEEIGIDATRYWLVMRSPDTHLEFDLDLAKEHSQHNPVYYVQYAHARICSILRKVEGQEDNSLGGSRGLQPAPGIKLEKDERNLLLKILRFPEEVAIAAKNLEPHRLPRYAEELATIFHSFYTNCRVLGEDKKTQSRRLIYIKATEVVLKNLLYLLGVSAPERM